MSPDVRPLLQALIKHFMCLCLWAEGVMTEIAINFLIFFYLLYVCTLYLDGHRGYSQQVQWEHEGVQRRSNTPAVNLNTGHPIACAVFVFRYL